MSSIVSVIAMGNAGVVLLCLVWAGQGRRVQIVGDRDRRSLVREGRPPDYLRALSKLVKPRSAIAFQPFSLSLRSTVRNPRLPVVAESRFSRSLYAYMTDEKRFDTDGQAYTQKEFAAYYGDSWQQKWDSAEPALPGNPAIEPQGSQEAAQSPLLAKFSSLVSALPVAEIVTRDNETVNEPEVVEREDYIDDKDNLVEKFKELMERRKSKGAGFPGANNLVEKRIDVDGGTYSQKEFEDFYGSLWEKKWNFARFIEGPLDYVSKDKFEKRLDTEDGGNYTMQEFEDCYGRSWKERWDSSETTFMPEPEPVRNKSAKSEEEKRKAAELEEQNAEVKKVPPKPKEPEPDYPRVFLDEVEFKYVPQLRMKAKLQTNVEVDASAGGVNKFNCITFEYDGSLTALKEKLPPYEFLEKK